MTVAEARNEIEIFAQASTFPTLASGEVDLLVRKAKRASAPFQAGIFTGSPIPSGLGIIPLVTTGDVPPDTYAEWTALTAYALGATVVPVPRVGHYYTVTVAGTSGAAQPTFPTTAGATVTDGSVMWTETGAAFWVPTFNLAQGIMLGWRLKSGKLIGAYDFHSDDQRLMRSQMSDHCLAQEKLWRARSIESIVLQGSMLQRRTNSIGAVNNLFDLSARDCASCYGWGCSSCGGWIMPGVYLARD